MKWRQVKVYQSRMPKRRTESVYANNMWPMENDYTHEMTMSNVVHQQKMSTGSITLPNRHLIKNRIAYP